MLKVDGELKPEAIMPHFDNAGNETWVCQKGGHICTGSPHWVERDSAIGKELGCHGNVCHTCFCKPRPPVPDPPAPETHVIEFSINLDREWVKKYAESMKVKVDSSYSMTNGGVTRGLKFTGPRDVLKKMVKRIGYPGQNPDLE